MTKSMDPRQGLHRNLNLLEAYKVYEKDYPLFLPDISATLAMNSPLYHRIDETLTLQSLNKSEYEQDEAQLRGAAMAGGVPLEQLRQAFRIFRESQQPMAPPPPPPSGMPTPQPAPPPPPPPTVVGASLNRAATQADTAGDEQLRAAHARMAQTQQEESRARATAASVAANLQGGQTPAQRMTHNLNAAAAAQSASRSHPGTQNEQEEMARWILNHQDEIENYMRAHPSVSSEDAARDIYMKMTGRPLRRGASTARASTGPAPTPPTTSTTRRRRPGTASSSTTTTRQSDEPSSENKRRARYPPPHRQAPMKAPRLFAKKMEPIPEPRIDWSGTPAPAPATRQPRPVKPRIVRQGRSRSPPPRVGRTQRSFYNSNYRDV